MSRANKLSSSSSPLMPYIVSNTVIKLSMNMKVTLTSLATRISRNKFQIFYLLSTEYDSTIK